VLGALWPAWQASRVSVLRALSPRAHAPDPRGTWWIGAVGLALIAFQLALLAVDGAERRFYAYSFIGLPALQVGWFLLAVPVLAILARIACGPVEAMLALPRGMLSGSAQAHPYRLGLVAGALMVGVGILVSTWTNGRALLDEITERVRFGDAFAFKTTGFGAEDTARLRMIDGPTASAAIGYLPLQVMGTQVFGLTGLSPTSVVCIGFEPRPFMEMNRLEWIAGDPEHATGRLLDGDAVLVAEEFLVARGLGVGSTITIGSASNSVPVEIVGVVGAAGLDVATQFFGIRSLYSEHAVSCIFMDFDAAARHFGSRESYIVQMQLPDSVTDEQEAALATAVEDAVPGAVFASGRQIRQEITRIGRIMLGVSSGVACGALGLACIAAASVIAAGVAGRAQEFGILQAVGGSRSTVVRLVCAEALLIGITAAAVGAGFGMHLAWMGTRMYRELAGLDLVYAVQPDIIALGALAVTAAALAASWPAGRRTASRPIRELLAAAKA
jgi:putative ABC transport system permease protein